MQLLETFFIGISLAMDAFAVAICKGLAMKQMSWKKAMLIGLYFGFFQMLMPIIGYIIGIGFSRIIRKNRPLVCIHFTRLYRCKYDKRIFF